MLSQERQSIHL